MKRSPKILAEDALSEKFSNSPGHGAVLHDDEPVEAPKHAGKKRVTPPHMSITITPSSRRQNRPLSAHIADFAVSPSTGTPFSTADQIIILEEDDDDTPHTNVHTNVTSITHDGFGASATEEDESVVSADDLMHMQESGMRRAGVHQRLSAHAGSIQHQPDGDSPTHRNTPKERKTLFGSALSSIVRRLSPRSKTNPEHSALLSPHDQSFQYTSTPSFMRTYDHDTTSMVPSNLSFTASPSYLHQSMQNDEPGSPNYYYQHASSLANLRADASQLPSTPQLGSVLPSSSNNGYVHYLHLSDKQQHQAAKVTWNKCVLGCIFIIFLVVLICFAILLSAMLFFRDAHFQVESVQVLRIPTYRNMRILFRIELTQYNPNVQEIELLLDRLNLRVALLDLKAKTKHQLYHPINADTGFNVTETVVGVDTGITRLVIDSDLYVGDVPYFHDLLNYFKPQRVNSVAWKMNGELQYKCMFLARLVELNHIQRLFINKNQKSKQGRRRVGRVDDVGNELDVRIDTLPRNR